MNSYIDELIDAAIERLCNDPEVWLTHGLPPEHKIERIKQEMRDVVYEWASFAASIALESGPR